MKSQKRIKRRKVKRFDRWPVTYRLAAMGTLLAFSALGVTKVALGRRTPDHEKKKNGRPSGSQGLRVRRFHAAGTLGDTLPVFASEETG